MEDAGILDRPTPPSRRTIYQILKKKGLASRRCAKRPKLDAEHATLRLKFTNKYCNFNWRRRVVKFSNKCSVVQGSGKQAEWCFRYPHEKFDPKIITPKEKLKQISQMV